MIPPDTSLKSQPPLGGETETYEKIPLTPDAETVLLDELAERWEILGVEDLGHPAMICELCRRRKIRYVYHVKDYSTGELKQVGRVCAGHLTDTNHLAEFKAKREVWRKEKSAFINKGWKKTKAGNDWKPWASCRIAVSTNGHGSIVWLDGKRWGERFQNCHLAKEAVFNFLHRAK
ncbi:MAG: hypothetical protein ACSHX4_10575 [Opitutaceae bacterium]